MAKLKRCPVCGGRILTRGMPVKITTPKLLRPAMYRIGVMCVSCGHWKHSIRAWNRRHKMAYENPCIYKHTCGFEICMKSDCPYYEPKTKGKKWFEETEAENGN